MAPPPRPARGFVWFVSGVCVWVGGGAELWCSVMSESPAPQASPSRPGTLTTSPGLETGLTHSRRGIKAPLSSTRVQTLAGPGRSGGWRGRGYNWPSPGPVPPQEKGPRTEGSLSQPSEGMCLIKIHKNIAGEARAISSSQSILVCVLPGKSGLCRKNFPNGFHMSASPERGLPPGPG